VISASWYVLIPLNSTGHDELELIFRQALDEDRNALLGVIVCKLEPHRGGPLRGYIAMLATRSEYRGRGIATKLVRLAVEKMIEKDADEVKPL